MKATMGGKMKATTISEIWEGRTTWLHLLPLTTIWLHLAPQIRDGTEKIPEKDEIIVLEGT